MLCQYLRSDQALHEIIAFAMTLTVAFLSLTTFKHYARPLIRRNSLSSTPICITKRHRKLFFAFWLCRPILGLITTLPLILFWAGKISENAVIWTFLAVTGCSISSEVCPHLPTGKRVSNSIKRLFYTSLELGSVLWVYNQQAYSIHSSTRWDRFRALTSKGLRALWRFWLTWSLAILGLACAICFPLSRLCDLPLRLRTFLFHTPVLLHRVSLGVELLFTTRSLPSPVPHLSRNTTLQTRLAAAIFWLLWILQIMGFFLELYTIFKTSKPLALQVCTAFYTGIFFMSLNCRPDISRSLLTHACPSRHSSMSVNF